MVFFVKGLFEKQKEIGGRVVVGWPDLVLFAGWGYPLLQRLM